MTPRVITGVGVVSTLGTGVDAFFDAMRAGPPVLADRPAAAFTSFDASGYGDVAAAEVPGFDPPAVLGDKGLRVLDRLTKLLLVAARLGLQDAGLKKEGAFVAPARPESVGVCCSNAYGSLEAITELDRVAKLEDARYINPAKFPNTVSNSASGYVSIWEDLRALNVTVSDGNCGGLDALSCADVFLTEGRADQILTGGGEAMSEALYLAFRKLGALGESLAIGDFPGPRLGEGAAFLALETEEGAKARGAKVLGAITGYGTAFKAPDDEVSLLFVSEDAIARAAAQALEDAGVTAKDVDLVVSSGCGLPRFDAIELSALERVVPGAPVAAPKLALGETLGAGGTLGVVAALAWIGGAKASLLVRGDAREVESRGVRTVLVTAVGYYGNASAVVVRAPG